MDTKKILGMIEDTKGDLYDIMLDYERQTRDARPYRVEPSDELIKRGREWYVSHYDAAEKALAGLTQSAKEKVMEDYAALLVGLTPSAPPEVIAQIKEKQMRAALRADEFILYVILISYYYPIMAESVTEWDTKRAAGKKIEISTSLANDFSIGMAIYSSAGDLDERIYKGLDDVIAPNRNRKVLCTALNAGAFPITYILYLAIAARCLGATAEEIDAIRWPWNPDKTIQQAVFQKLAAKIAAEDLRAEKERLKSGEGVTIPIASNKVLRLSQGFLGTTSAPLECADNKEPKFIYPVAKIIDSFARTNPEAERCRDKNGNILVTEMTVQRVLQGINAINGANLMQPAADDRLMFRGSLREFARYCGLPQINGDESKAILGTLVALQNIYVRMPVVKYRKGADGKQHKKLYYQFKQILNVPEYSTNDNGEITGDIKVYVYPDAFRNNGYKYATAGEHFAMLARVKSLPQSRFNDYLRYSPKMEEGNLIDRIFGYSLQLGEAERELKAARKSKDEERIKATEESLKKLQDNIRKHRGRDRKQILSWFEDYKARGWLEFYTRTEKVEGGKKTAIYEWKMTKGSAVEMQELIPSVEEIEGIEEQ